MCEAREDNRGDMKKNEGKGDIGDDLVHLLHLLAGRLGDHSGKRTRLLIAAIDDKPVTTVAVISTRSATTM
jgi:hypothetical protein